MNTMDNLKESQLKLIYGFILVNQTKENTLLYDLSSLYNVNYSDEDVMEQINNITSNKNKKVEGKKISLINRIQLRKLDDISVDTSELLNPFLSITQLRFLIEFKKQKINIDYVVNENLTVNEMSIIINYVLKNGYDELYDLIKYMNRVSLDTLLYKINNSEDIFDYLTKYKSNRDKMIDAINEYDTKEIRTQNRGFSHCEMVKVYTLNRYKKNN